MRSVVASTYVTLDGAFEEPSWRAPYWLDDTQLFADAPRDELELAETTTLPNKLTVLDYRLAK